MSQFLTFNTGLASQRFRPSGHGPNRKDVLKPIEGAIDVSGLRFKDGAVGIFDELELVGFVFDK